MTRPPAGRAGQPAQLVTRSPLRSRTGWFHHSVGS